VQIHAAALELELVDLTLAEVLTPGLEGQDLQVAGKVLELGQQLSNCHPLTVALQARCVVARWTAAGSIG
jgi:hypothetical protein